MLRRLTSHITAISRIFKDSFLQQQEKAFIAHMRTHTPVWEMDPNAEILCQMPWDYGFLVKFCHVAPWLAAKHRAEIRLTTLWISAEIDGGSMRSNLIQRLVHNSWAERKWQRLYESFGGAPGPTNRRKNLSLAAKRQATNQFHALQSKDDVLALNIHNLPAGDLIYDTYLRFRPAPTVDIRDPFLLALISSAWEVAENYNEYLDTHKVRALLTSYTSYIHHGLPARICLARNIPVLSMGRNDPLLKQVTVDFPSHARAHFHYPQLFASLPDHQSKREAGRAVLESRFQGQIDQATSYMRTSAFAGGSVSKPFDDGDPRPRALVLLHCFFDSPHIYRDMLFPDFYEWLEFTLTTAARSNARFYVKPHPNAMPGNAAIVADFQRRHPHVTFLDAKTSNRAVIAQGVEAIFTVYGTCAHEFPWFGIPAACAGDNPHIGYAFAQTAKSREEYAAWILNPGALRKPDSAEDRHQIEEFAYMHGLYAGGGRTEMPDPFHLTTCPVDPNTPEFLAWQIENRPDPADAAVRTLLDLAHDDSLLHRL